MEASWGPLRHLWAVSSFPAPKRAGATVHCTPRWDARTRPRDGAVDRTMRPCRRASRVLVLSPPPRRDARTGGDALRLWDCKAQSLKSLDGPSGLGCAGHNWGWMPDAADDSREGAKVGRWAEWVHVELLPRTPSSDSYSGLETSKVGAWLARNGDRRQEGDGKFLGEFLTNHISNSRRSSLPSPHLRGSVCHKVVVFWPPIYPHMHRSSDC